MTHFNYARRFAIELGIKDTSKLDKEARKAAKKALSIGKSVSNRLVDGLIHYKARDDELIKNYRFCINHINHVNRKRIIMSFEEKPTVDTLLENINSANLTYFSRIRKLF